MRREFMTRKLKHVHMSFNTTLMSKGIYLIFYLKKKI